MGAHYRSGAIKPDGFGSSPGLTASSAWQWTKIWGAICLMIVVATLGNMTSLAG